MNSLFQGALPSYAGVKFMVVEAGTTIKDERTGQTEEVTDKGGVFAGSTMYCTAKVYERIKQEVPLKG